MKVKMIVLVLAICTPAKQYAQTVINKMIPVKQGETVRMHFDYSRLIKVSTWEGAEISVQGHVMINGGENDDAFLLESTKDGGMVDIRAEIKDIKNLPQRITLTRDGQKIMFRNKEELRKYQAANGGSYNSMSWGPDIDIELEIKVPKGIATQITSVYGMVEVTSFSGPLSVEATYGGVDASLTERAVGELTAETNYGQIYTNLDTKFGNDKITEKDFYMSVSARPGQGPRYNFESKYGNVYLRKGK